MQGAASPAARQPFEEYDVHKDQIKGAAKDIIGSAKEGIGKAVGNDRLVAEGLAERGEGKAQKIAGAVKDAGRQALKN